MRRTEVRRLVESGLAEATKIITEKRQDLETLAKGLLEYETLTGEEIVNLMKGRLPVRDTGDADAWLSCPHHRRCSPQTRPRAKRIGAATAGVNARSAT
jgi:hypothetical protein